MGRQVLMAFMSDTRATMRDTKRRKPRVKIGKSRAQFGLESAIRLHEAGIAA